MRLALSKTLVVTAAQRFANSYPPDKYPDDTKWGRTRNALAALDPHSATAVQVAEIIGNASWSYFTCDECSQPVEKAVEVGGEFCERPYVFCPSCLRAASALGSVVL